MMTTFHNLHHYHPAVGLQQSHLNYSHDLLLSLPVPPFTTHQSEQSAEIPDNFDFKLEVQA
jgi:hypothetical protein